MERPKITHVAIRFNGSVYSLPAPNRHHDVIMEIMKANSEITYVNSYDEDQGFLDETGKYLNRKQALLSALLNNQVKDENNIRHNMLFSEDVW